MLYHDPVGLRGVSPGRAELAELVEATTGQDLAILDPILDTALTRRSRDPEAALSPAIRDLARTRRNEGHDVSHLLADYAALREALLRLWESDAPGPLTLLRLLNTAIDEAILVTVQEYRLGGDLLSMVCHDLRNPLQSLLLCGTQLERIPKEEPRMARVAEVTVRATARMNRILDDLALFASMDLSAPADLTTADPRELRELLEELLEGHRAASQEKRLRLAARPKEPLREVLLDRKRTLRVMHHLINHAIKVSPPEAEITLGVCTDDRATRFSVEHQGRSPRSLDMAIARALASGFGGDLRIERDGTLLWYFIFG